VSRVVAPDLLLPTARELAREIGAVPAPAERRPAAVLPVVGGAAVRTQARLTTTA
jgi:hypothetical protein